MNTVVQNKEVGSPPAGMGRWTFWQARSNDFQDPFDLIIDRDVPVYLRALAYMMDERPPLTRTDAAWARHTGKQSPASWRRAKERLITAGLLTSTERGLSAPRAELEWEVRDRISEQKSANSRGRAGGAAQKARSRVVQDMGYFPNDSKDPSERPNDACIEMKENESKEAIQEGSSDQMHLVLILDKMLQLPGRRQGIERILKPLIAVRRFVSPMPEEALDNISLRLSELTLSDAQCEAVVREVTARRNVCVYVSSIDEALSVVVQRKNETGHVVVTRADPLWGRIANEYRKTKQSTLLRIFEDSEKWPIPLELLNRLRNEEATDAPQ